MVRDLVTVVSLVGLLVAAGLALFLAHVLARTWEGMEVRGRLRRTLAYAAGAGALGGGVQVPVAAVYGQGLEPSDVVSALDTGEVVNELVERRAGGDRAGGSSARSASASLPTGPLPVADGRRPARPRSGPRWSATPAPTRRRRSSW